MITAIAIKIKMEKKMLTTDNKREKNLILLKKKLASEKLTKIAVAAINKILKTSAFVPKKSIPDGEKCKNRR